MNDIIVRPPLRNFRIGKGNTFHNVRTSSSGKKSIHQGLDFSPEIPGVTGQPIEPAIDGRIVFQGELPAFGNNLTIETVLDDGRYLYTSYNHLQDVKEADKKEIGAGVSNPLGRLGNSGTSSFKSPILPHLHFETIVADGKLDFSNKWPLEKGASGTAKNGVKWERISPKFEIGDMIVTSTPDRVRATLKSPWATPAAAVEAAPSFDDRYSAAYPRATTPTGDAIGRSRDVATTHDRDAGVGRSPSESASTFFGPSIPFASQPSGSMVAPGGPSSLLDPTPMDRGEPGPFSTGGRLVPRASPFRPLYPTGALVPASNSRTRDRQGSLEDRSGSRSFLPTEDADRLRSPVLRELQRYRRLDSASDAAASSTAPNIGIARASSGADSGAARVTGGIFKWIGNGLTPPTEALPSRRFPLGDTAPNFLDESNGPVSKASAAPPPSAEDNRRYLSRRVVDQGSAFDTGAAAVPFIRSNAGLVADYPNPFEDGSNSTANASHAQLQRISTSPGFFAGQPLPSQAVALPIFDLLNRSTGRENSADEREPLGTGIPMLDEYIRYLNRQYPS